MGTRLHSIPLAAGLLACVVCQPVRADEPAAPGVEKNDPAPTAAPEMPKEGPAAPAQDPRDREIQELRRIVDELRKRVDDLEKRPPAPAPPVPVPETTPPPEAAPPRASGGATFLPNISIVGNLQFGAGDRSRTDRSGRFRTQELEIAIQDAVAPGLRYDGFITAEHDDDFRLGIEEFYLTASKLRKGLTGRAGIMRVPFGKVNPTHPHSRVYIDQPSVMTAFLGPDGLRADGAVLEYLLPTKGFFARAELGLWDTLSETEDGLGFNGGNKAAWSGRLYLGKELGQDKELEIGFSRYQGRGHDAVDSDRSRFLAVNGLDFTYRAFPGSYRRFLAQAEIMTHDTGNTFAGAKSRFGGYGLLAWRWNQFWEAGVRGDYTEFPFPISGTERAVHLFLTKYVTEQTSLRVQLTHGASPGFSDFNQIFFQVLFGSGPHTHNLQ